MAAKTQRITSRISSESAAYLKQLAVSGRSSVAVVSGKLIDEAVARVITEKKP